MQDKTKMGLFTKKSKFPDRVKDLELVVDVFKKHGVEAILVYGALLGFVRDGDFLEHDDDIDLAIIDPIDLKTRKAIGWALYDLGFQPQNIAFNVFGRMEPSEIGYNGDERSGIIVCERKFPFSIFFFDKGLCEKHQYLEYICTPKLGAMTLISTPAAFFKKLDTIKINGRKYLTPSPIEKYLEFSYRNWRDKLGRDHSPTYLTSHPEYQEILNIKGKNEVLIIKNEQRKK